MRRGQAAFCTLGCRRRKFGGPRMIGAGFESWFAQERLAVRGFVEVVRHLRGLLALRRELVAVDGS